MHPWEFDPDQPKVREASLNYRFRHYTNLNKTRSKLTSLLENFQSCRFITCSEYLKQAENAVALAVKQAYLGVELAVESRRLAEQTEASAQEDFNLAQEKYNLGAATILDLLDALESLTRAQNDKVNALYDHFVAVAGLEKAIGRGQ